jgi:hypothetical protein
VRCCARCGGKVTLRSAKLIWVCILCRKKQELLIKSGKWMEGGGGGTTALENDPILRRIEMDMAPMTPTPTASSIGPSASFSSLLSKALPSSVLTPSTPSKPAGGGGSFSNISSTKPVSYLPHQSVDNPVAAAARRQENSAYLDQPDNNRPSSSLSSYSSLSHHNVTRPPFAMRAQPGPYHQNARLPRQRSLNPREPLALPNRRGTLMRTSSEGGEECYDPPTMITGSNPRLPPLPPPAAMMMRPYGPKAVVPLSSSYNAGFRPKRPSGYYDSYMDSYSAPEEDHQYHEEGAHNLYPRVLITDQEARDKFPESELMKHQLQQQKALLDPARGGGGGVTTRRKMDPSFRQLGSSNFIS